MNTVQKHHQDIIKAIKNIQELSSRAKQTHTAYDSEFDALHNTCGALLDTNSMIAPDHYPDLIRLHEASLEAITSQLNACGSKPKAWRACETPGEQATHIIHAIEGVIRSFLKVLSLGYVKADNQANYFFQTPHHKSPETQEFKRLLANLNSKIEELKQTLTPDIGNGNTQAP